MRINLNFKNRWGEDATPNNATNVTITIADKDILELTRELGTAIGQALQAQEQPEGEVYEPDQN
jgi:hypothetical protein